MPAPSDSTPADRPRVRQVVLWAAFTAVLAFGLVLYFRYAGRIVPLVDVTGER
jgi:hypothetical protein